MNPLAILSLLSDLYSQVQTLQAKIEELEKEELERHAQMKEAG